MRATGVNCGGHFGAVRAGCSGNWLSGVGAPVYFASVVGDVSTLLVPAGSTCSSVAFKGAITNAPIGFVGLGARLVVYANPTGLGQGGVQSVTDLCQFNPNAAGGGTGTATCSTTTPISIGANDQLAICFQASYSTPPNTRASWNVRCIAP